MTLSIRDIASALKLPITTVERWAKQGHIPTIVRKNVYVFDEHIIKKWAQKHQLSFSPKKNNEKKEPQNDGLSLTSAMQAGSFIYGITGQTVEDILSDACQHVPLASHADQRELYHLLVKREQLTSTGIGKGIAIPHSRTPLPQVPFPLITTCFLKEPVDFKAIDDQAVFVLFILICPTVNTHLKLLSRLAYCIRDAAFIDYLRSQPDESSILSKVNNVEKQFSNTAHS
jgi:PTS system nitrogen regulatory IIA component